MMRVFLLLLAATATVSGDDDWDKVVLLQKVKRHVAEAVKQLPDYTCLQTSARYRQKTERETERLVDTVVLEVLNAGSKELYAPPGAKSFEGDSPTGLIGGGLSGTGAFGLYLRTLFVNDNAQFQYKGEGQYRGKRTLRWDYRVARLMSGFTVQLDFSRGTVGMRGTVMVDPETFDLVYLSVLADEIPANLPLVSATQIIEYAPARIGDRDVVLPQTASLKIDEESGSRNRNVVEFTHCQSFRVETKLSYTATKGPERKAAGPEEVRPMSPGLTVSIALAQPITHKLTVGTLIEGRVTEAVRERGKVVIAAGSAVRGRIRRMERAVEDSWAIGLEFTEVETEEGPQRFYANLVDLDKSKGLQEFVRIVRPDMRGEWIEEYWLPYLPGVAQFYVMRNSFELPKGFKTVWKTTYPRSARR